jgi:hypothetical protein
MGIKKEDILIYVVVVVVVYASGVWCNTVKKQKKSVFISKTNYEPELHHYQLFLPIT